ncbi:hypothetical protein QQY24_04305 [Streptomyces sp. TG1A-8]|uniref:hypothetical protein n=1 Tax=Streptomyces sp. TG1A-8 TaxID=3051385 RepID=UPI00265C89EC|nr:hypothetical protein [Streptomyces sp. TG1A-8]MDO0924675.1 hypothetical protein [Streptomyces sp. TG1A-8]
MAPRTVVNRFGRSGPKASHGTVSSVSCTTDRAVPSARLLHQNFGVRRGLKNAPHACTGDQRLRDAPHRDFHRARAAADTIIPTTIDAARTIGYDNEVGFSPRTVDVVRLLAALG